MSVAGVGAVAARRVATLREPAAAAPPVLAPLDLRVRRVAGVPVVALRLWLRGGARAEARPGESWAAGRLLAEGTRRRDWRRLAEDAEDRGASILGFGSYEVYGLAIDALAGDWEWALEAAAEILFEGAFGEDRMAHVRRQGESELASDWDQPEVRTSWAFLEQLYSPHPRARPVQGDEASLAALTAEGARSHHAGGLTRGLLLTVAGEVDEAVVRNRAEALFRRLPGATREVPPPPPPTGLPEARREIASGAIDQAHLYLGQLSVPRLHPDHAALELLGVILGAGAGLTGRIPERVREREGLAYTAHASAVSGASTDPGRLVIYIATSPGTVEQAEAVAREELGRLLADGIGEQELSDARSFLLGREPFRRETARQWSDLLAESAYFGLPLDDAAWCERELLDLDRAAVEAAARRHIRPGELKVTVGLPGP
jgi:zinc protease